MGNGILKLIQDGTLFSNLLENKKVLNAVGNIDQLTIELFNLSAKGYVSFEKESNLSEGDDYRIKLTDFGKRNLEFIR